MKVRAVWALLVTLCLLAAGGTRGIAADNGHHATTISAARHSAGAAQRARVLPSIVALAVEPSRWLTAAARPESRSALPASVSIRTTGVLACATSPRGPPAA